MVAPSELPLDYVPGSPAPATGRRSDPPPPARTSAPALPPPVRRAAPSVREWLIADIFLPAFRPLIATETVWRFADRAVFLDGQGTGVAGPYNSERTPWTRAFQETFTDPRFDEDHVIKSSRVGMTEAALNVLRFMPEHAPGPALFAIDSTKEAKDINRERLIPTLRRFAETGADPFTDDPDDVTGALLRLRAMTIKVSGSYSAGTFRNKGLRCVILDEVEVVSEIDSEGTLHDLARSRQNDVPDAKLFTMSKPRSWGSAHHRECVTGSLEAFLVPCPHCGTYQELAFDGASPTHALRIEKPLTPGQAAPSPPLAAAPRALGRLRFDACKELTGAWDLERIERETYYECVAGCRIDQDAPLTADQRHVFAAAAALADSPDYAHRERHAGLHGAAAVLRRLDAGIRTTAKWAMVNAGQWLRTNPRPVPRKRSRHISDLYTLHEKLSWGRLARIHCEAQGDPQRELHFINNHLGLPYREKSSEVAEENVLECRSRYERGTTPFEPDLLCIGADSQDAFWKLVVSAYRADGECAVIRHAIATTPAELIAELDIPVPLATDPSKIFYPTLGFVDAGGHRSEEVYDLFAASGGRLIPCYGRREPAIPRAVWKSQIQHRFRPLDIYFVADAILKRFIYLGQIQRVREIKAAVDARDAGQGPPLQALGLPPRLHLPMFPFDAEAHQLHTELQGETLDDAGKWQPVAGRRNDFGDALKYSRGAFEYLRPVLEAEAKARAAANTKNSRADGRE